MSEVINVSLTFPTVLFSFCLFVIVLYWLAVLVGASDVDLLDIDAGGGGGESMAGALLPTSRVSRGIPVTIVLSLWIVISWCACAAGTIVLSDFDMLAQLGMLGSLLVAVVAPLVAWVVTVLLVMPLGRLYRTDDAASRHDFVGTTCVIRTATVNDDFGQAEITSADGSTAIVQVRSGSGIDDDSQGLTRGTTALIFEYDSRHEVFRVTPFDPFFGSPRNGPA